MLKMAVVAFSDDSSMTSCLSSLYSLDQGELLLNDLLNEKPESPRSVCHVCDEGATVTSRCRDCNEALCDSCVRAHQRVRFTKDHVIDTYKPSPSVSPQGNNLFCDLHITEIISLYCESCNVAICGECVATEHSGHAFIYFQDACEQARKASVKLLCDIRNTVLTTKENLDAATRMIDNIELRSKAVVREIKTATKKLHMALEERERELLNKVERIRLFKGKVLNQQIDEFRLTLTRCGRTHDLLNDAFKGNSSYDLLQARNQAVSDLKLFKQLRLAMHPNEDDNIFFFPPDQSLYNMIASMGNVSSSGFAPPALPVVDPINILGSSPTNILATSPILGNSIKDLGCMFNKCHLNDNILGSDIVASISPPDGPYMITDLENRRDNGFNIPYRAKVEDSHKLQLMMRGKHFQGNSYSLNSRTGRNYTEAGIAKLTFGNEGDKEGELCRPWGICCDRNNNIIVADRSNNRIQIFSPVGIFIRKFGRHGSEPGEFDRPAGVATDPANRIVVADKDNHRIQVFTMEGEFVHMFGEKGSKNGQFNYPWDVDVDINGRIVVSDTRNHRIQLFAPDGTFLNKYGYENNSTMWKHFDSPRGVCFGFNGMVIVTDFNNHRLVVIDSNFRNARFLGSEGSGAKEFLRPQGVAVDRDGQIIVADSRNHRIQVFEANGSFLWQFGEIGKEPSQLDRPSGVCLTNDGQIVVVDFGNNRIQIF